MRLRNKKTGETGFYLHTHRDHTDGHIKVAVLKDGEPFSEFKPYEPIYDYDSLAELNEEWEDYEESKEYWCITGRGNLHHLQDMTDENDKDHREIGNYFETEEEAEKAVEKLKAWKQLKDIGCRFVLDDNFAVKFVGPEVTKIVSAEEGRMLCDDYRLLFGGEE